MDPKETVAIDEAVPAGIVRDSALRKERVEDKAPTKDRGANNDEHDPEGSNPTPGNSEWTENLFTGGDWRVSANAWAGFGLRLLLICGTLFSVFQYLAARHEARVDRALQLVELWDREEYQDAQKAVKARLATLNEKYQDLLGKNPSQTEYDIYYAKIGLEALKPDGGDMPLPEFQDRFDRVVYFLNRVSSCVQGNLCDQSVADDYFKDYAQSFWRYFRGYVEKQRKGGSTTYAVAIEKYAGGGQMAATTAK